jgi:hypothetical protein
VSTIQTKRWADAVERIVWTVLQGGAAEGIVLASGISQAWTVPIMALLATLKTTLASKFGTSSASTLPAHMDAAA